MKKKGLDGLPGLTMQGTKGAAGKRGYATFYNYNENYKLFTQDKSDNLVYGEMSLGFSSSSDTNTINTVLCIPNYSFTPIINDRLLNTSESGLDLYEIKDFITVPLVSETDNVRILDFSAKGMAVIKNKIKDEESLSYIFSKLQELVAYYKSSKIFPQIEDFYDDLENFNIYILEKLDTITFSKQNFSNSIDNIEVSMVSKNLTYDRWEQSYCDTDSSLNESDTSLDVSCGEHKYDIIIDYSNLRNVTSSLNNMPDDEGDSFRSQINNMQLRIFGSYGTYTDKLLSGIDIVVTGFHTANIAEANSMMFSMPDWEVGTTINNVTKVFETNTNTGIIDDVNTRYEGLHAKIIKISAPGFLDSYYLLDHIDNSDFACMRNSSKLDVYMYEITPKITTDKISVTDYYPYVMSDKPLSKEIKVDDNGKDMIVNAKDSLGVMEFTIFMPIDIKERRRVALYAEFTPIDSTVFTYKMSTALNNIWYVDNNLYEYTEFPKILLPANIQQRLRSTIASMHDLPRGYIENYRNINFDDEDPGSFTMILKDFEEGNETQQYISTKICPGFVLSKYTVNIYMYYKTTNASYQKMFLGSGAVRNSIEE